MNETRKKNKVEKKLVDKLDNLFNIIESISRLIPGLFGTALSNRSGAAEIEIKKLRYCFLILNHR